MKINERKEIVRKIANGELIYIPNHLKDLVIKFYDIYEKLYKENGVVPSMEEISFKMNLDIDKVKQLKEIHEQFFLIVK